MADSKMAMPGSTACSEAKFSSSNSMYSDSASGSHTCKQCKLCRRSSLDLPWTRSGGGYECRACASYLMFNYRGKLKNELAEKLKEDHDGTVRAGYIDELADYELGQGGVKRPKLQAQEKTTKASVVKHGNFWPKDIQILVGRLPRR